MFLDESPEFVITACSLLTQGGSQCGERLKKCDQDEEWSSYRAVCPKHGVVPTLIPGRRITALEWQLNSGKGREILLRLPGVTA